MMTISVLPALEQPGKWGVYVDDEADSFLFAVSKHSHACDWAVECLAKGTRPEVLFENPEDSDVVDVCNRDAVAVNAAARHADHRVVVSHYPERRKKCA